MLYSSRTQSARTWKYINYVSDRAGVEEKWNVRMLDIDHPADASRAAFKRVCEHIRYNNPAVDMVTFRRGANSTM